jgi:glycosyltransferase involved in cell wall biosynthesis
MKIVHVIDYFYPKLGYQETFLSLEHSNLGNDVYVITSDYYDKLIFKSYKSILKNRYVGSGFVINNAVKIIRLKSLLIFPHCLFLKNLEYQIEKIQPDIIIVHGITNLNAIRVALLKKKKHNFKLIYDDHMAYDNSKSFFRIFYPIYKLIIQILYIKNADAFIAVTTATKLFMNVKYGINVNHIKIIPLGADINSFKYNKDSRYYIRKIYNIDNKDVVYIFTGKITPEKKIDILIKSFSKLNNHENLKLMIIGNGDEDYIKKLKALCNELSLNNKCIWINAVPNKELHKYYSAADIAVWPYGASISQREAISNSLPIIVSNCSPVTDLVKYGNGFTYKELNIEDLTNKMEILLDKKIRCEMAQASRKFAETVLDWKIIAKHFIDSVT